MFQKLIAVGRLGKDAELKYTQSGNAVANFSIACTEKWKKDGDAHEATEWFRCNLFGKRAEGLAPYLLKGTILCIEGRLRTRIYEGKYYTEVAVDNAHFVGGGKNESRPKQQKQTQPEQINIDEIPF